MILSSELYAADYLCGHIPTWQHVADSDTATFNLNSQTMTLAVSEVSSHVKARWILEKSQAKVAKDAIGYSITFDVINTGKGWEEYAIFSTVLRLLDQYFSEREWDYLHFNDEDGSRFRLYDAVSQRMTKTQDSVERRAYRGNDYVVARF